MEGWRVYVRDADRVNLGQLDVWDELTLVMRNNRAGSFTLRVPGDHAQAELLSAGVGIVAYSPHVPAAPIFSGPVRTIERASVDGSRRRISSSLVQTTSRDSLTDSLGRSQQQLSAPRPIPLTSVPAQRRP